MSTGGNASIGHETPVRNIKMILVKTNKIIGVSRSLTIHESVIAKKMHDSRYGSRKKAI